MKIERAFISPGAKPEAIAPLRKVLADRCSAFCVFYERSDVLEFELMPDYSSDDLLEELDCIRLNNLDFILNMITHNARFFPGVLVVANDAGTNRFALDLRVSGELPFIVFRADEEPYLQTARLISRSFGEFLARSDVTWALNKAAGQSSGIDGLPPHASSS